MTQQEAPETLEAADPKRVTLTLPEWAARLRDPGVRATAVLVGLAAVGFVMFGLAWRGTARTVYVPLQMPWLVSGAFMALALLGFALGAWSIHLSRRDNAAHRAAFEDFVRETAELAEGLRAIRPKPAGRAKPRKRTERVRPS